MHFWRWKKGRQDSEYYRLRLVHTCIPILWDCYLIKMGKGSHVPTHTDPAPPKHKHYRLNIVLKQTGSGGHFVCGTAILNFPRLKFFDATKPHSVTTVIDGKRLLLSIGWLWGRKSWTSFLAFASLVLIIALAIATAYRL